MEIEKVLEIKVLEGVFNVNTSSRKIFVYQFETIETIELKFRNIDIEHETLLINRCFIKANLASVIGNQISKLKIEHNLSSLGEASIFHIESYFKKGFKVFIVETAGFDRYSILHLYNFIKSASYSESNFTIVLLVESKMFNILFNDNENRILSFDNISLNDEKHQFRLKKGE